MQGTVHLLFGAAVATLLPYPWVTFVVAFFSHYILDYLPHIDPETYAEAKKPYTWTAFISLVVDIILVVILLIALYILRGNEIHVLIGAIAAQLPDLLTPLESYPLFSPLKRVHEMFHWNRKLADKWSWYLAGLASPIIVSVISLYIIWSY